jgi:hypothetical protein
MFLVYGLPRYPERFGDLGPGPALAEGAFDFGVFESIGEFAERDDGGESVCDSTDRFRCDGRHVSNLSC